MAAPKPRNVDPRLRAIQQLQANAGGLTGNAYGAGWPLVTPQQPFGARGDGVTDDTSALQAWLNYLVTNHMHGYLPAGNYRISSALTTKETYGWGILGAGKQCTFITQTTGNTPVLDIGGAGAQDNAHSIRLEGFTPTYSVSQPSTSTNAIPVRFSCMVYLSEFLDLGFNYGRYAMAVKSGVTSPWGCSWNDLTFGGGLTGGAIDASLSASSATPENRWGRFYVDATSMTDFCFKGIRGYNWQIGVIEVNNGTNVPGILQTQAGAMVNIGAIKWEVATFNDSGTHRLVQLAANSNAKIGQLFVGGSPFVVNSGTTLRMVEHTGGGQTYCDVDIMALNSPTGGGSLFVFSGGGLGLTIGAFNQNTLAGWNLTNAASTGAADNLTVRSWANRNMAPGSKGDADYTIALGDPTTFSYETTLTAQRTMTLPGTSSNNLHSGLSYTVRAYGAINGTNAILVVCNGVTVATLGTDKVAVTFTWRRFGANPQSGWKMTGYQNLP